MAEQERPNNRRPSKTLRERAEKLLRATPEELPKITSEDVRALVLDLCVHEIELEAQNEELRQAQFKLSHARDYYADLYDFSPVGYVTLNQDGEILDVNMTASTLLAVPRQGLLHAHLSDYVARESQADYFLHWEAIFSNNDKQTSEVQMHTADGRSLVIRLESIAVGSADERKCRSALIDISATRQAQKDLTESERRYHRLTDAVVDYIFTVNIHDGSEVETIHGFNCEAITGYTPEEFATNGLLWISIVPPEDRVAVERHIRRTLSGERPPPLEHRIRQKDGTVRWVLRVVSPTFDDHGKLLSYDGLLRDITEQKLVEQALRTLNINLGESLADRTDELERSLNELRLLSEAVSNLGEGVLITNDSLEWPGPQIVFVNDALCRITGYTAKELIGRSPRILQGKETDRETLDQIKTELSAGRSCEAELVNYRKDRTRYDAELFITPLSNAEGQRTNFVSIHRDITEQKRVRAELRKNEERLRAILNTAADAIINIDHSGRITDVNPATEEMFGYTQDELIGQNVSILMPSPHREEHDCYLARYLSTGEARIIGVGRELTGIRKDGLEFPLELSVTEVDHLGLFTGFVRDITVRKAIENSLRQEHKLSESIIETAHVIILHLDNEGRIVRYNPFLEKLSGYPLEECLGKEWFECFLPARDRPRIRELFRASIRGETIEGNVNPIVSKSGRELNIRWWAQPLKDGDGNVIGLLSIGLDITELKLAQERLVQSERLAAIGEAMTGLTHESRNALANSQAFLRRLARRIKHQPELLELIDSAVLAQEDLKQLFEDVRQYAAPIRLKWRLADVGEVIEESWSQLGPSRQGRDATLHHAREHIDLDCEIDRFHIAGALRNILENALAACEDPVRIDVNYTETENDGRAFLRIAISDNGPGLDLKQANKVFDAFYTTKTHGTGLGLAIVKRTIEQHGGRIAVSTNSGGGAKFILTLPRRAE